MTDFNIIRIRGGAATDIERFSTVKLASLCEGLQMPDETNIFITDEVGTDDTTRICSGYGSGTFIPARYFDMLDHQEQLYCLAQSMHVITVTEKVTTLLDRATSYRGGLNQCLGVLGMMGGAYYNNDNVGMIAMAVSMFGSFCSLRSLAAEEEIERLAYDSDEHALKVTGNIDIAISAVKKEILVDNDDSSARWRLLNLQNIKAQKPELTVPVPCVA